MKFNTLFKAVLATALIADFLDWYITLVALSIFPPFFEANPYIRLLMLRFKLPPLTACTAVFSSTLTLVALSYTLLRKWLSAKPYTESLGEVGRYLWNLSSIQARDLAIFGCLTLLIVLTLQHLYGFISWLKYLIS